jgi:ATP-dependent DNA helicase PIF1
MRQQQALRLMMEGHNVFLTGAPGAGKTYVLNEFIRRAVKAGKQVGITASTGIAASHIGGTTIHSWSGLGIMDQLTADDLKHLSGIDRLIKRYNSINVLVIDEVSMLHGKRLNMVNELAKKLRGNDKAFGGIQVILVGDLFQLPPISRGSEPLDFMHLSATWEELDLRICYLNEQHRQDVNDKLLMLLEAMRRGSIGEEHELLIQERLNITPDDDIVVTRLYSHNLDVDSINQRYLDMLPSKSQTYQMQSRGSQAKYAQLTKGLLAPEILELKIGAEVMFVANNFADGFVNGSRGQVIDFDGDTPVVKLTRGKKIYVEPHTWSMTEDGKVRAEAIQLPLRLAWAMTIHKSQGMSLDAAEIDLSRAFTPGMGYVALSRVRSLDGLYIKGINTMALNMHPQIYEFDNYLRNASVQLSSNTEDMTDEIPEAYVTIVDESLLKKLKQWRFNRSKSDNVPPYMIAHNTSLSAIAAARPANEQQLLSLSGFGVKKVEAYGPDILAIVKAHIG